MQERTNFAIVSKEALNEFSQQMVTYTKNIKGGYDSKDWKWKVIGNALGDGGVYYSQPMVYIKKVYWGDKLAKFYNTLLV